MNTEIVYMTMKNTPCSTDGRRRRTYFDSF